MLTTSGLSAALKSAFIAEIGMPASDTELQQFCDAVANGLVPYLIANTEVLAGIPVTTSGGSGATSGPGAID